MTELQLKALTAQPSENGYPLPEGETVDSLVPKLLENLGSTDSKTRELSYTVLNNWIWANGGERFSDQQLIQSAEQLTHNLFVGLGERASNSVFLRSYASLILGDIIGLDTERKFLNRSHIDVYFEKALDYFAQEVDYRTVVSDEKGWAYAVPHATDLLAYLARHPEATLSNLERILYALSTKLKGPSLPVFVYNEDERLAIAAVAVLERNYLELPVVEGWLEHLTEAPTWRAKSFEPWQEEVVKKHPWWPVYNEPPEAVNMFKNIQAFVRSLYFQLKLGRRSESFANLIPLVEGAVKRLDTGFL